MRHDQGVIREDEEQIRREQEQLKRPQDRLSSGQQALHRGEQKLAADRQPLGDQQKTHAKSVQLLANRLAASMEAVAASEGRARYYQTKLRSEEMEVARLESQVHACIEEAVADHDTVIEALNSQVRVLTQELAEVGLSEARPKLCPALKRLDLASLVRPTNTTTDPTRVAWTPTLIRLILRNDLASATKPSTLPRHVRWMQYRR